MSFVAAGSAAVSIGMGIAKSVKANKEAKRARAAQEAANAPLEQAATETRMMKNVTQGAGMAQAQAQARQSQADTLGQAGRQLADPSKLAGVAASTNMQALQAGQQRDAVTEQQRLSGQRAHVGALSNLASGKMQGAQMQQQQAQNTATEASNLLGAGVSSIGSMAADRTMMKTYGEIEAGTFEPDKFMNMKSMLFGGAERRQQAASAGMGMSGQRATGIGQMGSLAPPPKWQWDAASGRMVQGG